MYLNREPSVPITQNDEIHLQDARLAVRGLTSTLLDLLVLGVAGGMRVLHVPCGTRGGIGAGHWAPLLGQEPAPRARLWGNETTGDTGADTVNIQVSH